MGSRFAPVVAAVAVAAMACVGMARAEEYPTKPITLIVPWTAGGPTDLVMRSIAEAASKHIGQPIVVDNRGGGGGTVGPATMAATAKPDGYTIAQIPDTVFLYPLMQKTPWDPEKDFTYIMGLSGYTFGATVPADSPFKSWKEIVDYARANPGKVTYGTPGPATAQHIAMERIAIHDGIKLVHVPFKGAADVNIATAGGHVMIGATGASAKPLSDAGKIRFVNIWTAKRVSILPEAPTLLELGYPFVILAPFGLAGPKGMDPKIVARIHDAFKLALSDPAVTATLAKLEMVADYKSGEDFLKASLEVVEAERPIFQQLGLTRKD